MEYLAGPERREISQTYLILEVTFLVYFYKIFRIVRNSLKTFVSQVKQFQTI